MNESREDLPKRKYIVLPGGRIKEAPHHASGKGGGYRQAKMTKGERLEWKGAEKRAKTDQSNLKRQIPDGMPQSLEENDVQGKNNQGLPKPPKPDWAALRKHGTSSGFESPYPKDQIPTLSGSALQRAKEQAEQWNKERAFGRERRHKK